MLVQKSGIWLLARRQLLVMLFGRLIWMTDLLKRCINGRRKERGKKVMCILILHHVASLRSEGFHWLILPYIFLSLDCLIQINHFFSHFSDLSILILFSSIWCKLQVGDNICPFYIDNDLDWNVQGMKLFSWKFDKELIVPDGEV